jgi:5-methylcytosine-specific restriction endonuclease McrA/endogenous inhibitor of DNA gyrase (YacG/DUF329 family)
VVQPICSWPGCDVLTPVVVYGGIERFASRCVAHKGVHAVARVSVPSLGRRLSCSGCGAVVFRKQPRRRAFCSTLCRRYADYGPWFVPVRHRVAVKAPGLILSTTCDWCGDGFESAKAAQRFCSHDHKMRARYARRWATKHGATGSYTWMDVTKLWRKFDGCCAYCGMATPLDEIQAEHVIALSNGGSNSTTNLLPSCGSCNANKRDLTLTEWAEFRNLRGLPPVVTSWDAADPRYSHLVLGGSLRLRVA